MARILRGDLIWADLEPTMGREQAGLRPVLVLSQEVFNKNSGIVIAMVLTSQKQRAGFPLTLELNSPKLKKKPSWVRVSQIGTLSVKRLKRKIGSVSSEELSTIVEGFNEIIGNNY